MREQMQRRMCKGDGRHLMLLKVPKKMGIFSEVDSGSYLTATQIIKRVIQNRLDYEARNLKKQKKVGARPWE